MTGMGGGHHNQAVIDAFHRLLLHQGFVAAGLAVLVIITWSRARSVQLRRAERSATGGHAEPPDTVALPAANITRREAPARRLVRIGFGLLWILDGVLQAQPAMPTSLVPDVIRPAAATSPAWVRGMVASASQVWIHHPASAAAAAVWIQVGLGVWLLVAPSGQWSTWAGLATAGWAGAIWVVGEAFGGLLGTGQSFLTGTPGAALLYVVAGLLVALPERVWSSERPGRAMLAGAGAFLVGMAVLEAWPGRGFWRGGRPPGHAGPLATMVHQMARTGQPALTATAVRAFASFESAHGWAVNLFVVLALAATGTALLTGAALLTGRRALVRPALAGALIFAAADWVLVQDLGFLGGVGTDPNSMVPWMILLAAGYLAVSRPAAPAPPAARPPWRERLRADPALAVRTVASAAAVGLTALGAVPLAVAAIAS